MFAQDKLAWLEEYEELMFGPYHTEDTITRAANIKYKYMPNMLFKYRCCSSNTFDALENDFLFSSQPSEFNDIFEAQSRLSVKTWKKTFIKLYMII